MCTESHSHVKIKLVLYTPQLAGCFWLNLFNRVPFWNWNEYQTVSEHKSNNNLNSEFFQKFVVCIK